MRPRLVLLPLLSVLVGTAAGAGLARRADDDSSSSQSPSTSKDDAKTTTTTSAARSTSTNESKSSSSSSASSKTSANDVTITSTKTVSGDVVTVTSKTAAKSTKTVTVTSVKTKIETETTTASGSVQTEIVMITTTVGSNGKRALPEIPAMTTAPAVDEDDAFDLVRLAKRATVTQVVETTVAGSTTTVWETDTEEATTTKVVESEVTSKITVTSVADASSTTKITSTITETSLDVSTEIVTRTATQSSGPASTSSSGSGNSDGGSSGSSGSESGLSTGAKAGIGAGVGVAGLVLIVGLAWFCIRRRRDAADHDHDDLFPASEVPVGAGGARASTHAATVSHASVSHQPSMSQSTAGAGYPTPSRSPTFPSVAPEGYRGTAMGDGRAGYAKPEPYGAGYAKPEPYGSAYTRTSTGPSSMGSVQDAYAPPNRTSTYDNAHGHDIDAANIGVASTSPVPHQYGTSGSRFSEMETTEQPYRPPYMDNVR